MTHHEHQKSDAEQPDLPSRKEPALVWIIPPAALLLLIGAIVAVVLSA
jgi:hypothetical protein